MQDSHTISAPSDRDQTFADDMSSDSDSPCLEVPPAPRLRPMQAPLDKSIY